MKKRILIRRFSKDKTSDMKGIAYATGLVLYCKEYSLPPGSGKTAIVDNRVQGKL